MPGERFELPTNPESFGAALLRFVLASEPLQIMNGKFRTFFGLQNPLETARFPKRPDLFACHNLKILSQPPGRVYDRAGVAQIGHQD